jgi:Carboxypeptidase regulatory-like domain
MCDKTLRLSTLSQKFNKWFVVLLLAVTGIAGSVARAQISGTGAISGTVQDPSGAVIANAIVTATNVGTNVQTVRTTTKAGDYNVTPLLPGTYIVTVAAQGFEGYKQENVVVDALVTVGLNVKLTVGRADEVVTITAAPPLLSTNDATLGGVMDNQMYSNLPIQMGQGGNNDQRRATDFEYLMPGVQSNFTSNNATSNSGSVNGSGPAGGVSEIYIDGINLPEADQVGDPRFTWTAIGVDAIDQFQVQTAGISSQYGGQGVQNYSIKSGGNAYHGSIYEYLRNTMFDAWRFTDKIPTTVASAGAPSVCVYGSPATASCVPGGVKPREIQNEFGIVLSGPILKNKLFLFGNYGQYRNQNGAKAATMTLPTAAMLGYTQTGTPLGYADFTGYAVANGAPKTCTDASKIGVAANACIDIYDPATQTPALGCSTNCTRGLFTGLKNGVPTSDIIPASRISAPANAYNKFLLPYELLTSQSTYTNNLAYGTPTGLANWYSTGSIDYSMNARNQARLIIAFGRQSSTGPNNLSGLGAPFNVSQTFTPVTTVDILKDTFTINSHLVNQFAIGYGRYQSDSVTPNRQPQYAAAGAGILNMPAGQSSDGFPGITFTGAFTNPSQNVSSSSANVWGGYAWNNKINNTYTITDNLQWVHDKQNITIGGQIVDAQFNYYKVLSPSGPMAFTFNQAQTEAFSSGTTLNTQTGSSVATYLLGASTSSSTSANVPGLGTRWFDPSFWVEDDYKVSPKLTLNLGLRWDIFPSIKEAHNLFTFLNPSGINSITGNRGTLEFAGNGDPSIYCNCKSPSPLSFKTFAPRLGLAWSVNPKTVVRGSYNVNFARGDWTSGSQSGSPSTLGITPGATAPTNPSSEPYFYWDATNCTGGFQNGIACGWTGSIQPPTSPVVGGSINTYGTGETNAAGLGTGSALGQTYFDPYRGSRTPEFLNWSFGLQRQVTRDMSLTVTYVGSQGHFISGGYINPNRTNHLTTNYAALAGYNINTAGTVVTPCAGITCGTVAGSTTLLGSNTTTGAITAINGMGFAPPNPFVGQSYLSTNKVSGYYTAFPQFSGLSDTTNFNGNTAFHALEISLRQRAAHGLDFMLNYTYSKSIDDVGTFRTWDNPRLDRSLSTTDQPQNLTATGVYQLPFGHGHIGGDNMFVNAIAGGWTLSSIFTYHSGSPLIATGTGCGGTVLNTCMPSLTGNPARQNAYGKNITAANGSPNYYGARQFLNNNAMTVTTAGTVANFGPTPGGTNNQVINVGQGPGLYIPGNAARIGADNVWSQSLYNIDFGVKRVFPIYENLKLQFEADMLNATNHVVWGAVNGGVGGTSYGFVTALAGGNSPRDFQFSGRLSW